MLNFINIKKIIKFIPAIVFTANILFPYSFLYAENNSIDMGIPFVITLFGGLFSSLLCIIYLILGYIGKNRFDIMVSFIILILNLSGLALVIYYDYINVFFHR